MNEIIDVFYYLLFFFLTEPEREAGRGSLLRETRNSLSLARLGGEDGKARRQCVSPQQPQEEATGDLDRLGPGPLSTAAPARKLALTWVRWMWAAEEALLLRTQLGLRSHVLGGSELCLLVAASAVCSCNPSSPQRKPGRPGGELTFLLLCPHPCLRKGISHMGAACSQHSPLPCPSPALWTAGVPFATRFTEGP